MATLSSDKTKVTVTKGDTLSEIALEFSEYIAGSDNADRIETLVNLNNIANKDLIYVGQVLKLSGTPTASKVNTSNMANITAFGLQANTDRTIFAVWTWSKSNTDNYSVTWYYDTGNDVWFVGSETSEKNKQSTYNAPENAKRVKFVVKPIAKKRKVNGKETAYWKAEWSTAKVYNFKDNPPGDVSAPSVEIKKLNLTARLDNISSDINATHIQFQIVKDDTTVAKTIIGKISKNSVSVSCTVQAGHEYKVRCRAAKAKNVVYNKQVTTAVSETGEWSDYSQNYPTIPATPAGITTLRATSETAVYLEWKAVKTAETYDIQYTTKKQYFDGSNRVTDQNGIETTHFELTGLETGQEYFFRIRAVNKNNEASSWSEVKSISIGKKPIAPTTWSSTTTVIVGTPLNLYWIHNTEDGSSQTYAELELTINGVTTTQTIKNSTDEEEKDKTSIYTIDTTPYSEGTKILWRVRTAGVTIVYGEWSVQRTVDVYAPATLELSVNDSAGNAITELTSFPFYVDALAGPNTQAPVGYHLSVISNQVYESVDQIGNVKMVNSGEVIYSRHFDISTPLLVELSAGNIDLENNIWYTVIVTVSMNSGLTVESTYDFTVAWVDNEYSPNAEIGIDNETVTASIRPYCEDENGEPIDDITLSVYRREYDGRFVEIATDIVNGSNTFVTDPHPALDYARYRIVAITNSTGAVSYTDISGIPVGETAAIIQWDEAWSSFDFTDEDIQEEPTWGGSILKLPYNIDVTDNVKPDVSIVEYIGRSHPIAYYGTQVGSTSKWNMVIPKDDEETLYALRRLAIWMGDVYVREPSGSGYWANVTVSYSQKHRDLTIPVTLDIVRVEGGV